MAQVHDRNDPQAAHLRAGQVGPRPVVPAGTQVHPIVRRAVPEVMDAQLPSQSQVFLPELVVPALLHLVPAFGAVRGLDHGIAALDSRSEDEPLGRRVRSYLRLVVLHGQGVSWVGVEYGVRWSFPTPCPTSFQLDGRTHTSYPWPRSAKREPARLAAR